MKKKAAGAILQGIGLSYLIFWVLIMTRQNRHLPGMGYGVRMDVIAGVGVLFGIALLVFRRMARRRRSHEKSRGWEELTFGGG